MQAQPSDKTDFKPVNIALATISDSRDISNDKSGDLLAKRIQSAGHQLYDRVIIKDDAKQIIDWMRKSIDDKQVDCIITTGGTGLTGRDVTPEAIEQIMDKPIPGFGEYFRYMSMAKIGTSTIQSRAMAALAGGTYIFALPGSPGACKDGWDEILIYQLDIRHKPCNFVELMPRLKEI